jgi:quinoprotein glucose dehydrogenase
LIEQRCRGGGAFLAFLVMLAPAIGGHAAEPAPADWPFVSGDAGGTRYSTLDQIDTHNVRHLVKAWSYRLPIEPDPSKHPYVAFEATPINIGDTLYFCTPTNSVVALDAESGAVRWTAAANLRPWGGFRACRGVAYYRAAHELPHCTERIVTATSDARLKALDASTGEACPDFGTAGVVDLLDGMGHIDPGVFGVTSAPVMAHGLIVLGGMVIDNGKATNPSGVIRAYDALTGKLAWAWDMEHVDAQAVPAGQSTYGLNTPNGWAPFSVDEDRGLVFVPTGNSNPDYYGARRTAAAEKYSSSVVALDADTGVVRWSFQTTHHDLWDYDVASQPVLGAWPTATGPVPAVIQATKRGEIFVLGRDDGRPLSPVEERQVPRGGAPGDHTAPTQPYSTDIPSLAGPDLTEADMWGATPVDQLWCRIQFRKARYEGSMTPPTEGRPWIYSPGWMGGNDWGSVSVDEARGILVAVSMRMANLDRFVEAHEIKPGTDLTKLGAIQQDGSPYPGIITNYFHSALGIPCQRPPYGMLSAIDLKTHRLLWSKPWGTARHAGPLALSSLGLRVPLPLPMGAVTMGGNLITKGGLVFAGASLDQYVRAVDESTGEELWRDHLTAAAFAAPMTYRTARSGRQFVVIAVGGNSHFGPNEGLYLQAYALPRAP